MIVEDIQFNISHVPQVLIWFQGLFYACIQPCVSTDNNCSSICFYPQPVLASNVQTLIKDILETSENDFSSCIVSAVVPHHLCYPVGPHESHQPSSIHFIFTPIFCCITFFIAIIRKHCVPNFDGWHCRSLYLNSDVKPRIIASCFCIKWITFYMHFLWLIWTSNIKMVLKFRIVKQFIHYFQLLLFQKNFLFQMLEV